MSESVEAGTRRSYCLSGSVVAPRKLGSTVLSAMKGQTPVPASIMAGDGEVSCPVASSRVGTR